MEKGLPGLQIARIDVAGGIPLVDAHNLVGEKSVAAEAVIDAGRPDIDNRDRPVLLVYQPLRLDFGNPVRQVRLQRRVFVDHVT